MALQKFREKQKLIYWVVAIVVIPSFCLFGFSEVLAPNPAKNLVGEAFGKKYTQQAFFDFYKRLNGIHPQSPVYFTFDGRTPTFGETEEEARRAAAFFCMMLRDQAAEMGIQVSDEEVNTFICLQVGYQGSDARELQKQVERLIGSVIRLDSVYEYKVAVREWLLARKLLAALDDTGLVPLPLAELSLAQDRTEYTFRKLVIPAEKFVEAADKELGALKAEELQARAQKFLEANQVSQKRDYYPFLWTEPQWRFEYVMAPLVVPALEPKITDEILQKHYEKINASYAGADGKPKPFEEVKADVENDYRRQFRQENARQTLSNDVDRFCMRVIREAATDAAVDAGVVVPLAQIAADPQLVKRGLQTGVSGDKPQTGEEIQKNPLFADSVIALVLADMDRTLRQKEGKPEDYKAELEQSKQTFRGMRMRSVDMPVPGKDCFFRIRLTDYVPGVPRKLVGADGKMDEDLLRQIRKELAEELALNTARDKAAAVKMDQPEFEGIKITEEKKGYYSLNPQGPEGELRGAMIGQVLQPRQYGQSFVVLQLTGRQSPQATRQEVVQQLAQLTGNWRGNTVYASAEVFNPTIKIGRRLSKYLFTNYESGKIRYRLNAGGGE